MEIAEIDEIKNAARDARNIVATQLAGYGAKLNKRGKPFAINGGLCTSVCMIRSGRPAMCMRCWYRMPGDPDMLRRMKTVADGLRQRNASIGSYFITYEIVERMISVNGKVLPGLLMEWLDGETLSDYVSDNSDHTDREIARVAELFLEMCQTLNRARVSHGDLSGGNVIVMRDGSLKLIDYDSVYFESMGTRNQAVSGDEAYQHPGRKAYKNAAVFADHFSQHLIYVSLLMIAGSKDLRLPFGNKSMLFTVLDLRNHSAFIASDTYRRGMAMNNQSITAELTIMANALKGKYESVPPLKPLTQAEPVKRVPLLAGFCTACGHRFEDADSVQKTFAFCTRCGTKRLTL